MHTNTKEQREMALSLRSDMSKAYDRVEWPFLKGMMLKIVFASSCLEFILHCISLVLYSIIVNGEEWMNFKPSRGFRRGDPLSHYLFLLCRESLSALMRLDRQNDLLECAKICRSAPPISHLTFVDDCIFFCETMKRGG